MRLWWHPESESYVSIDNPTSEQVMELLEVTGIASHEDKAAAQRAEQTPGGSVKIETLVQQYVQLRDKKAEISAKMKGKIGKIEQVMEQIEGMLLKTFEETGQESARTEFGTAYKSPQTSCTMADWESFLDYVRTNELWHLIEHRASKVAVEQFKVAKETENAERDPEEREDVLPPGLNWREETVINVRRSA